MKNMTLPFGRINLPIVVAICLERWLVGLALSMAFLSVPAYGEENQREKSAVTDESLEQRGKQLRAAIEEEYQRLERLKALTPQRGGNIGELVSRYIPLGASFDDAEEILRNAGFDVGARIGPDTPVRSPFRVPNPKYYLTAQIIGLDSSLLTLRTVSVVIYLTPKDPNNYDNVIDVGGSIYVSYP